MVIVTVGSLHAGKNIFYIQKVSFKINGVLNKL